MAKILRLRDPVLEARDFLLEYFDDVVTEIPPKFGWDQLIIRISDAGGEGEKDLILDRAILHIEVYSPNKAEASETCRSIHGLLRAWNQIHDSGPTWGGTIQRPTADDEPESRTPGYSTHVRLIFRAEEITLEGANNG